MLPSSSAEEERERASSSMASSPTVARLSPHTPSPLSAVPHVVLSSVPAPASMDEQEGVHWMKSFGFALLRSCCTPWLVLGASLSCYNPWPSWVGGGGEAP